MAAMETIWRVTDQSGRKATIKAYVAMGDVQWPNAAATAIETAINACSDCAIYTHELVGADESETGTAVLNAYGDPSDKLQVVMQGAESGAIHKFDFACPKPAIFLTDNETPDPAKAAWTDLRDWLVTNAKGTDGEALVFKSARRIKTTLQK